MGPQVLYNNGNSIHFQKASCMPDTVITHTTIRHASSACVEVCLPSAISDEALVHEWSTLMQTIKEHAPRELIIDCADQREYTSTSISMLVALKQEQEIHARIFTLKNSAPEYERLFLSCAAPSSEKNTHPHTTQRKTVGHLGFMAAQFFKDCYEQLVFTGELAMRVLHAISHPRSIRWRDFFATIESGGIAALPIIISLNFLMGVIMAFQSAIPMRQFGADVFVADLVALSIVRELGPLMTAIILAGRSGAAFAAEIGTMKVNEEIDALTTMGLNPIRFLVISRVCAVIIFMPVLTIFAEAAGIVGGACVFKGLGYPLVVYISHVLQSVSMSDFLGGLLKAGVFGLLVAAIGCLRGLKTTTGARAVGESATRAVVSGLVLIVLADGIFSIIYYFLGI